jgi:hypothetical protein
MARKSNYITRVRSAVTGRFVKKQPSKDLAANHCHGAVASQPAQEEAVSATQSFKVVEAELNGA